MSQDAGYNGWTNYETWNVALWLDNEQGTYSLVREWADEIRVDDMAPDLGASMFADLLGAALSAVDWAEIAENILSEV
jgi:hypothetical protein